jgi:hypothetical protein
MPARSSAQRRYLNMKFGHDWVKKHGFDNKGKLPAHAKSPAGQRGSRQEDMVRRFMKRGKRRKGSRGKEARQ